jgi:hypothetical protein
VGKPAQTEYVIGYDKFTDALLVTIGRKVISADYICQILNHIAKLYEYHPKTIYTDMEYMDVLEKD